MLRNRRGVILAVVAAFSTLASPADARGRGRVRFSGRGLSGGSGYGGPVLTREQLERCVRLERDINFGADEVDREESALNKQQSELERLGQEIDIRSSRMDRYSQASVDSYNRLVNQHQSTVNNFNARLPGFNARVETHNSHVNEFNASCAEKPYYEADMQAVRTAPGTR